MFGRDKLKWLKDLDFCLKEGWRLHAFLSAGGLRVVTLVGEKNETEFYGEAPSLVTALKYLIEDFRAGGREYGAVYGKKYPHYLTGGYPNRKGNVTLLDLLDQHVFKGNPLDAFYERELFRVHLSFPGYEVKTPDEINDKAQQEQKTIEWEFLGSKKKTGPFQFPNGEWGTFTSPGVDTFTVIKKGQGDTFMKAAMLAVASVGEWQGDRVMKILSEK